MGKELGFAKARTALESVASMTPKPVEGNDPAPRDVRAIVESQPETIRQSSGIVRKRQSKGALVPLNMRVSVDTFNRFVALSAARRETYAELVEALLEEVERHEGFGRR